MKTKIIVTIVLMIILFYLLFMKKVEGMEDTMVINKEEQVKEKSIFSFLEGLFRLFDFGGGDYGEQSCQINSDDLSDDFQKNVGNITFDFREVIATIFSNMASEDPYTKNCSISKKYFIEYGFSKILVDYVFENLFNNKEKLTFDQFENFVREILNQINIGSRRRKIPYNNNIESFTNIDNLEREAKGNPKELAMSGVTFVFCLLTNGRKILKEKDLNKNLTLLASVSSYSKNAMRALKLLRSSLTSDLFEIISDGKDEINVNDFKRGKIEKNELLNYYEDQFEFILKIFEKISPGDDLNTERIRTEIESELDRTYEEFGDENYVITIEDYIEKMIEKIMNRNMGNRNPNNECHPSCYTCDGPGTDDCTMCLGEDGKYPPNDADGDGSGSCDGVSSQFLSVNNDEIDNQQLLINNNEVDYEMECYDIEKMSNNINTFRKCCNMFDENLKNDNPECYESKQNWLNFFNEKIMNRDEICLNNTDYYRSPESSEYCLLECYDDDNNGECINSEYCFNECLKRKVGNRTKCAKVRPHHLNRGYNEDGCAYYSHYSSEQEIERNQDDVCQWTDCVYPDPSITNGLCMPIHDDLEGYNWYSKIGSTVECMDLISRYECETRSSETPSLNCQWVTNTELLQGTEEILENIEEVIEENVSSEAAESILSQAEENITDPTTSVILQEVIEEQTDIDEPSNSNNSNSNISPEIVEPQP